MTPTEKLMQKVIHAATGEIVHDPAEVRMRYQQMEEDPDTADARYDAEVGIRGCGQPTGLPCDYSRHYESKSVAAEMLDGSWVGWTYWYGGGKHGALELPEVHQSSRETVTHVKQDVENFLDPLVFHWDEEKYIVSEAIRSYVAQFDADSSPLHDPGGISWMEDAYDVATEVVMEPVRKFRRIGD